MPLRTLNVTVAPVFSPSLDGRVSLDMLPAVPQLAEVSDGIVLIVIIAIVVVGVIVAVSMGKGK